jgi:hypothetical protein
MPLIYNLRQNPFDRCSFDTRFYICSAPLNIERIARAAPIGVGSAYAQ